MDATRVKLEALALASLDARHCPGADTLAGYLLGDLAAAEQLSVAAHVRGCPLCQELIDVGRPPAPQARPRLATRLPRVFAEGRRGSTAGSAHLQRFTLGDLVVELSVPPPEAGRWRITGQIVRAHEGLAYSQITLRIGRRRRTQISDELGFFGFAGLPAGIYRLSVAAAEQVIELPAITLGEP